MKTNSDKRREYGNLKRKRGNRETNSRVLS